MATNQQGIAITIKAFLPMGRGIEAQFAALSLVKTAHETGDYSELLKAAQDVEVKTEAKTRRIEAAPAQAEPAQAAQPHWPLRSEAAPQDPGEDVGGQPEHVGATGHHDRFLDVIHPTDDDVPWESDEDEGSADDGDGEFEAAEPKRSKRG